MEEKIALVLSKIEKFNERVPSEIMPRTTAEILNFLILSTKSKKILEIGCSVGYSTIWMASAAKNFGGHIYTIDHSDDRPEIARIHFEEAGLSERITLLEGDAREILNSWKHGPVDFILIDATKKQYLEYYKLAFPLLSAGGVMVADDVIKFKNKMKDFLDYIEKDKQISYSVLNIDDGVMLIYKK